MAQNDSMSRLSSTQAVASIRMTVKGVPTESTTTSQFFIYEYGLPQPGQKYRDTRQDVNDLNQIRKRRYNPEFWRTNAVIKASPIEEGIIQDFEGHSLFGKLN